MGEQQVQMIVERISASFSSIFDFAFSANILAVWGPPFALGVVINLFRVALGKGYEPGADDFERAGERELRQTLRDMQE